MNFFFYFWMLFKYTSLYIIKRTHAWYKNKINSNKNAFFFKNEILSKYGNIHKEGFLLQIICK